MKELTDEEIIEHFSQSGASLDLASEYPIKGKLDQILSSARDLIKHAIKINEQEKVRGADMILNQDKKKSFNDAATPLMEWLKDNVHPHTAVIVDSRKAELFEGVCVARTEENKK